MDVGLTLFFFCIGNLYLCSCMLGRFIKMLFIFKDCFFFSEEQHPPCLKEYMSTLVSGVMPIFGEFRPRCRPDGFYYHTQCRGSTCFCYDRCGNTVPGTNHPVSSIRERICGKFSWERLGNIWRSGKGIDSHF